MTTSQQTTATAVEPLTLPALRLVAAPRATRKLATLLTVIFLMLPLVLLFVPWQQNVPGLGRVVALDPIDRTQTIPAPVTGRLVKVNVIEGTYVEQGDVLAEMADQDPQYAERLQRQKTFADEKVTAAEAQVENYKQQLENQEEARDLALTRAQYELDGATEKVNAEKQALAAAEADFQQKEADWNRKWRLYQQRVASELDWQLAQAAYRSGRAKVREAKAKVGQAENEEKAKREDLDRLRNDLQAKIESTRSLGDEARSKYNQAKKEQADAETKVARQDTQVVRAPRTGYVLRVHAANSADFLSQGDPLIELIPDTDELAAELWVRGNDAPLITPGRKVRLQFEGWPAVQFAGWPSVAVGTFGGRVAVVDRQGASDGRFRVLIVPDEDDLPWPSRTYLRQGARANGWVLLEQVRLGYELWRQLNAFPPTVAAPQDEMKASSSGSGKSKSKGKGKDNK